MIQRQKVGPRLDFCVGHTLVLECDFGEYGGVFACTHGIAPSGSDMAQSSSAPYLTRCLRIKPGPNPLLHCDLLRNVVPNPKSAYHG